MYVLDYAALRDTLFEALAEKDLQGSIDEALYLNVSSRGCEIFVHPFAEPEEVWGKISFEWVADNQVLYEELTREDGDASDGLGDPRSEVMMHVEFHLHFGDLSIATDAVRDVAKEIKGQAEAFFGDDGGVVAEVSMTSDFARLECLRFEVNTTAPLVSEESWWEQLADVCYAMLDKLQEIYLRLNAEYGTTRENGT